ncbi:uncharacterized protein BCR38DRAFT_204075 [Pseudomassariella vexata]|uniref:Secreted protein n=1 Tax=Pseudomassariella vexata TaxID=1141098 RepID=A0A1Y2DXI2_9PEZI|nr:uncharacterized protein BCR38DRAFT_204075 [Pseudomassariella vexata]ORY64010.1 hypothetical protein BCR38DRAFT_204075 [Pseudomassariella vexata]
MMILHIFSVVPFLCSGASIISMCQSGKILGQRRTMGSIVPLLRWTRSSFAFLNRPAIYVVHAGQACHYSSFNYGPGKTTAS